MRDDCVRGQVGEGEGYTDRDGEECVSVQIPVTC
jgi:hypothetical protein